MVAVQQNNGHVQKGSKRTSAVTEPQKFRKKNISDYLHDGASGSNSNQREEDQMKSSGQNVMVAPKREMILDFHPKDSIASEKLNE